MAVKKTQSQMWQEFGAFLRGEDISAGGEGKQRAKTVAAREKALRERFDPSYRPTRVKPTPRPGTSVGGGRGTNPGNPGPVKPIGGGRGINPGNPGRPKPSTRGVAPRKPR
jgi:hypothetical protein